MENIHTHNEELVIFKMPTVEFSWILSVEVPLILKSLQLKSPQKEQGKSQGAVP